MYTKQRVLYSTGKVGIPDFWTVNPVGTFLTVYHKVYSTGIYCIYTLYEYTVV